MNPHFFTALEHTTGWSLFVGIDNAFAFVFFSAAMTALRSVKGTRRRYIAASVIRGFGVPLAGFDLFATIVQIGAGDYFAAFLSVVSAFYTADLVRRHSGDDDFWSDTSKKLKRRLKSLTGRRRPAYAGTGA